MSTIQIIKGITLIIVGFYLAISAVNTKIVASVGVKLAEKCSDQKKITKCGFWYFFIEVTPAGATWKTPIMKKHKRIMILDSLITFILFILALFLLIILAGDFYVYVCLVVHAIAALTHVVLLFFLLAYKKRVAKYLKAHKAHEGDGGVVFNTEANTEKHRGTE